MSYETAALQARIKIDTDIAYEKGRGGTRWPTERFVIAIDGVWLVRKDGGLRKFKTKQSAYKAAMTAAAIADIEKEKSNEQQHD